MLWIIYVNTGRVISILHHVIDRWATCLLDTMADIQSRLAEVTWPYLLIHGDQDKLCELSGSDMFDQLSPSKDKTYKVRLLSFSRKKNRAIYNGWKLALSADKQLWKLYNKTFYFPFIHLARFTSHVLVYHCYSSYGLEGRQLLRFEKMDFYVCKQKVLSKCGKFCDMGATLLC